MSSIEEIDAVYEAGEGSGQTGWQVYRVPWPALARYRSALRSLEKYLADHGIADDWATYLTFNKRFLYFLSSSPVAPAALIDAMLKWGASPGLSHLRLKAGLPATAVGLLARVEDAFRILQVAQVSPLWEAAVSTCLDLWESPESPDEEISVAILYSENRLIKLIRETIRSTDEPTLHLIPVRSTELKQTTVYSQLIVFGPTARRYDDGSGFVLRSPRAWLATLFVPDCFKAEIPEFYELAGSPHNDPHLDSGEIPHAFSRPSIHEYKVNGAAVESSGGECEPLPSTEDAGDGDDWLAVLPAPRIIYRPFADSPDDGVRGFDTEPAMQVLLSADHIVYLPEEGLAYRLVESEDVGSGTRTCVEVEHIGVNEVGCGDILLFSEEGGGQMILEVANGILGGQAHVFRSLQTLWKQSYIRVAAFDSDAEIIRKLKDLGARSVTPGMIRNWRNPLNIGPGSWKNFEALLKFSGIESRRDEVFHATQEIRSAHQKAGAQLAGRLREMMRGQSLAKLHAEGRQVFGGTPGVPTQKVAFFVLGIIPGTVEVLPHDLSKAQLIPQESWQ